MKMFISRTAPGLLIAMVLTLASCSSSRKASYIDYNFVDWEGRAEENAMQDWIEPALNNDLDNMPQEIQSKLKDKFYLVVQSRRAKLDKDTDADLNAARQTAEENYQVTLARTINAAIDEFSRGRISTGKGGKELLSDAADGASFSGFTKVADSWVLTESDEDINNYDVVQIYACGKKAWVNQSVKYIKKLSSDYPDNPSLKKASASAKGIATKILPSKVTIVTSVEKR